MSADDRAFTGSIPEIYDRLLVPLIFDPYARDIADRVAALKPKDVLETAAGTGALTRAMAARLSKGAHITATDLNQPMLDRASAPRADGKRTGGMGTDEMGAANVEVAWQQADALALPFGDQRFDVVVCQFGMMFFPDKVQGYREARRVAKPGGTFIFSAWDRISENVFIDVVSETLARMFPDDPPNFMARTPHGFHDVAVITRDLTAAGFASHKVETLEHIAKAATPRDVAAAYCLGSPLKMEIEARNAARMEEAVDRAADALAQRFGSGPIEGRISAHVISASG